MTTQLDYLDHLARESARFREAVGVAAPSAAVPSCPDWDADDLLWHLGEVQWFWGTIVQRRLQDPAAAEALKPDRPADRGALMDFYQAASAALQRTLRDTDPSTEVWTWAADHSVGFIRRRQAHEALIHRVDAELATGARTPLDPQLSADGVDEVLRVMYGGLPPWGSFAPDDDPRTVRLHATDTGDSWLLRFGRFSGTDPDGTSYDDREMHPDDADSGDEATATLAGPAAALNCWLWHRPTEQPLERTGDEAVLAELEEIIAPGID
jgi:uncharacterized protein (TIGR03083 family)